MYDERASNQGVKSLHIGYQPIIFLINLRKFLFTQTYPVSGKGAQRKPLFVSVLEKEFAYLQIFGGGL